MNTWAWILSPPENEEVAQRFLSSRRDKPAFLLLEVLRRDVSSVKTLRHLLKYSWDIVNALPSSKHTSLFRPETKMQMPYLSESASSADERRSQWKDHLTEHAMWMLWTRLLDQVLLLWPLALVSLSHMVRPILLSVCGFKPNDRLYLDGPTHRRACRLFNTMLCQLSVPAAITPAKSIAFNWKAQKVLLSLAEDFTPPLLLSHSSYRSIAQVLVMQRKNERELKVTKLQKRSWPPWRKVQDGMDAQRPHDADHSRVVSVLMRARESGFRPDAIDFSLMILGGQEPDGTPTIQTRARFPLSARNPPHSLSKSEWAARIFATRDVQEAWGAFSRFQESGDRPSLAMYSAMLQKLEFDRQRIKVRYVESNVVPGQGLEILAPANDNFTAYYQQSLQPPTKDDLYIQMLKQGHRPAGRLLNFLIAHARTPDQAFQYLRDSGMDERVIEFLEDAKIIDPVLLKSCLHPSTLSAFLGLICRFAPRVVSEFVDDQDSPLEAETSGVMSKSRIKMNTILELNANRNRLASNPLQHALDLLRLSQTQHRRAWYMVFGALSLRGVIIVRKYAGEPLDTLLAWRVLEATLHDFHSHGMELNPEGFLHLCRGLEKGFWAAQTLIQRRQVGQEAEGGEHEERGGTHEPQTAHQENIEEKARLDLTSSKVLIMKEFWNMTDSSAMDESYHIPALLHSIDGVHIHAYVRVVGIMGDHTEIMNVLQWMVDHHLALEEISMISGNGARMFRTALVAIKAFLHDTEFEAKAKELVNNEGLWGGWPPTIQAQKYVLGEKNMDDNSLSQ